MDSALDIIGRAQMGTFNTSKKRNEISKEYFKDLRNKYQDNYTALKILVLGEKQTKDNERKYKSLKTIIKNTY